MTSKKYIKNYDLVEAEDDKGRVKKTVVYHGDYFHLNYEESQIKKFKWEFILLFVALLALHISAGLVNNPGLNQLYTALPYTASFFPLIFLAAGILRIPYKKGPYRIEEVDLSYQRIVNTSRFYMILMGIGVLGILIYLIFVSNGQTLGREAIYISLVLGAACLVWIIFQKATKITFEKEETPINSE